MRPGGAGAGETKLRDNPRPPAPGRRHPAAGARPPAPGRQRPAAGARPPAEGNCLSGGRALLGPSCAPSPLRPTLARAKKCQGSKGHGAPSARRAAPTRAARAGWGPQRRGEARRGRAQPAGGREGEREKKERRKGEGGREGKRRKGGGLEMLAQPRGLQTADSARDALAPGCQLLGSVSPRARSRELA